MDAGDFVEKLDKLNRLKSEGIIDEDEYQAQVDKLQKQCSNKNNIYGSNRVGNTNTATAGSAVGVVLFLIIIIVGGVCFFSSDIFEDITKAGKEFVDTFKDDVSSGSSYDYSKYEIDSSGTGSSGTTSSNPIVNNPITTESKSSYMSSCKNYDSKYQDMQRDPNSYKGLRMKVRGMVESRWSKNGSMSAFTLSACTSDNRYIGMFYCTIDKSVLNGKNLLQYDYINVYGEFTGLTDNLYSLSGYLDYPHLEVKYIEFTTY